jgi:PrtD family type I secretion system ABC transporter
MMQKRIIDKSDLTPLKEALLACRVMVKYILMFGCITNILLLSTSIYSMQVLDRVLSSGSTETLIMLTIVVGIALALLGLIQGARSFSMTMMGTWFEHKLSKSVFANSIRSALESRANANSQQMRDLQTIKTYLTSPGLISIMDTPWAIIFIIVLFILHTYLGLLAVLGGVIVVFMGLITDRATKPLLEATNEDFIKSMRQVDQATRNAEIIEVMGLLKNVNNSWEKINDKVQNNQSLSTKRQSVFMEITKFVRLLLQISVTGMGAYLVLRGELSSGAMIASSSLVARALAPFEAVINSWKGYVNCRKAYSRLDNAFIKHMNSDNAMSLPPPEGRISFENVYFAPPGGQKHIIKGMNFVIEPADVIAVMGNSGSGKTSLAKLMVGAWQPVIGTVRIDGASIRDWNRQELGQYIGYLPQDIELFSGTVKENIARMNQDPNPEDVVIAAQLAGVHDMILQLPKGYDTEIGMDGSTLSGGQRQRIGLARAFFGEPRMIILDEPNSSLDAQGEEALSTAIEVAKEKNMTVVIISHRTAVLSLASKIMLVRDGMVTAFGPKEEILAQVKKLSAGQS